MIGWEKERTGPLHRSELAPLLFNKYMIDQPILTYTCCIVVDLYTIGTFAVSTLDR